MLFSTKDINNINYYIKQEPEEIEIRFKFSPEIIQKLYLKLNSENYKCSLQNSVILSYDNYRRESFYDGINKTGAEDIIKSEIGKVFILNHKIAFASEKPTKDFNLQNVKSIRLKVRKTFIIDNWKWVFTATCQMQPDAPNLKQAILQYFQKENIINEFELEAVKLPNIFGINTAILKVYDMLGDSNKIFEIKISELYKYLGKKMITPTLKNLLVNPHMLGKYNINEVDLSNYMVLDKTDGLRCILQIYDENNYIEYTEGNVNLHLENDNLEDFKLIDCEKVGNEYWAFDILPFDMYVSANSYEQRVNELIQLQKQYKIFNIKTILPATSENIKKLANTNENNYKIDGLIFNEKKCKKVCKVFKWKPAEMLTFDFLIVPMKHTGTEPFIMKKKYMYLLMAGCDIKKFKSTGIVHPRKYNEILNEVGIIPKSNYIPVIFSPPIWRDAYIWHSNKEYPPCVGEFLYQNKNWKLEKIRDDKTKLIPQGIYGNDYFNLELHLSEALNPLTLTDLSKTLKKGGEYFKHNKTQNYKAQIKFNSFVKFKQMEQLRGCRRVLDIASGKGQDLFIYYYLGIEFVYFVEKDNAAVIELAKRIKNLNDIKYYPDYLKSVNLNHKFEFDIKNISYEELIAEPPVKVDAVVCNFAIHYFLNTPEDYKKFASYCFSTGAKYVILTFLDSEIVDKYTPYKTDKYFIEHRSNKYYIKHHFSDELYPENIIDTELLIKSMKKYKLIKRDSFGRYLNYERLPEHLKLKDEDDELYCSFYQYLVFMK